MGIALDIDCINGYGPETITVNNIGAGIYTYRVNHYNKDVKGAVSQQLLDSLAQVTLYTTEV